MIDKYVDPAIATTLLKREGALSGSTTTLVREEAVNKSIVTANTKLVSPLLQDLMIPNQTKEVNND